MKKRGVLLIGMPGSGKTTIGRELSKVLKMNFLDMDEFIERSTGKEIKELFAQGEAVFRDLESKSCELLATLKNVVISSGGGIVTREEISITCYGSGCVGICASYWFCSKYQVHFK